MAATVAVTIEKGQWPEALSLSSWIDFKADLRILCQKYMTTLHTMADGIVYRDDQSVDAYILIGDWPSGMKVKDADAMVDEFMAALNALSTTYSKGSISAVVGLTFQLVEDD